jgi:putative transposase
VLGAEGAHQGLPSRIPRPSGRGGYEAPAEQGRKSRFAAIAPAPATTNAVGIDAGITSLLTLSTGEKVANPKHERRDRARLAKAQRELSRKAKGSANREQARRKVARVHARIADRRRDFLHKLSTRLVRQNQTVVIEDLTVRNLLKNGKLARAISDASWTELRSIWSTSAPGTGANSS